MCVCVCVNNFNVMSSADIRTSRSEKTSRSGHWSLVLDFVRRIFCSGSGNINREGTVIRDI